MKKNKIVRNLLISAATLVAIVALLLTANAIYTAYEAHKYVKPGKMVETENGMMHVYANIKEDSEITYVFLTGLGGHSSYFEFKALREPLSENASVVTVDYLGYGMSENTTAERSIANIASEINTALVQADISGPYSFVVHSIGGYSAMAFTMAYPEKVADLIFIDSSVPELIEYTEVELLWILDQKRKTDFRRFTGLDRFDPPAPFLGLPPIPGLTPEEQRAAAFHNRKMAISSTVINEINHTHENSEYLAGMQIPDSIPVLMLLSQITDDLSVELGFPKTWRESHEQRMNNNPKSELIMFDAGHMLHRETPEEVLEAIKVFHKY